MREMLRGYAAYREDNEARWRGAGSWRYAYGQRSRLPTPMLRKQSDGFAPSSQQSAGDRVAVDDTRNEDRGLEIRADLAIQALDGRSGIVRISQRPPSATNPPGAVIHPLMTRAPESPASARLCGCRPDGVAPHSLCALVHIQAAAASA